MYCFSPPSSLEVGIFRHECLFPPLMSMAQSEHLFWVATHHLRTTDLIIPIQKLFLKTQCGCQTVLFAWESGDLCYSQKCAIQHRIKQYTCTNKSHNKLLKIPCWINLGWATNAFRIQVKSGTWVVQWHIFTHFYILQKPQELKTTNFQMHLVG